MRILGTAALGMALLLSGCGFHVRGSQELGGLLHKVYVDANAAPLIKVELQRQLVLYGVPLVYDPNSAEMIVTINKEAFDSRVLSVDPETGKVRKYELGYRAGLSVRRPDGTVLLEEQAVDLLRDYTFDETAVLGKFFEETVVRADLIKEAADSVIRRLQTIKPAS